MIFGNPSTFGIEVDIQERLDGWVFGKFLLHIMGSAVGNPEDATDLKGCLRWLEELDVTAPGRYEPSLDVLDAQSLFRLLCDDIMAGRAVENPLVPEAFARFHVTQIGMSSLDRYDLMLLLLADGRSRLLWRKDGGEAHEAVFPGGEMKQAVSECCGYLKDAILRTHPPPGRSS